MRGPFSPWTKTTQICSDRPGRACTKMDFWSKLSLWGDKIPWSFLKTNPMRVRKSRRGQSPPLSRSCSRVSEGSATTAPGAAQPRGRGGCSSRASSWFPLFFFFACRIKATEPLDDKDILMVKVENREDLEIDHKHISVQVGAGRLLCLMHYVPHLRGLFLETRRCELNSLPRCGRYSL